MKPWAWLVVSGMLSGYPSVGWALSVSPTVVELRAEAGAEVRGVFQVVNDTEESLRITVEREVLSSTGYIQCPPEEWLELSPSTLDLKPHQQAEVAYHVSVPQETSGELAAEVVFVQPISNNGANGGVEVRFGIALYVSILGTEHLSLTIGPMSLQAGHAANVRIPITNRGNVHCRPEGSVTVSKMNGTVLAQGRLARGMPAPPGRLEAFTVALPNASLGPGTYRLTADLTCEGAGQVSPGQWTTQQLDELDNAGH